MLLPLHPARGVRPQTFLYFFAWLLSHFFYSARTPARVFFALGCFQYSRFRRRHGVRCCGMEFGCCRRRV